MGDQTVQAHRCVLAAASNYFDRMFSGTLTETNEQEVDLSSSFESARTLKDFLGFIYGCEITISEENVRGLLQGAALAELPELKGHCLHFLLKNLNIKNCLWTWTLAELYSFHGLEDVCRELASCRFKDTIRHLEETCTIPVDHFFKFVLGGMIKHCNEEDMVTFVKNYLAVNNELDYKKKEDFIDLFGLTHRGELLHRTNEADKHEEFPNAAGDISKRMEDKDDSDDKTEDAVLFEIPDEHLWYIYRSKTNEWLTAPDTYSSIGFPDFLIALFGSAPEMDFALLSDSESGENKLLNLETLQTFSVPCIPAMAQEKLSIESRRKKCLLRCHNGEIHCILYSGLLVEKKVSTGKKKKKGKGKRGKEESWMTNLRGIYDEERLQKVEETYIWAARYEIEKKKWKFVCEVHTGTEPVLQFECLQQEDGSMYVLAGCLKEIHLYLYNPTKRSVLKLKTYIGSQLAILEVQTAVVCASEKAIFVSGNIQTLKYDKESNIWSTEKDATFRRDAETEVVSISESQGIVYMWKLMQKKCRKHFYRYNVLTKETKELGPIPYLPNSKKQFSGQNQRVPTNILMKLHPVVSPCRIDEQVLSASEVQSLLKQHNTDTKEDAVVYGIEDDQWHDDDDYTDYEDKNHTEEEVQHPFSLPPWMARQAMAEQMMAEAFQRETIRRMFNPFGF